jgi:hypothetical protein
MRISAFTRRSGLWSGCEGCGFREMVLHSEMRPGISRDELVLSNKALNLSLCRPKAIINYYLIVKNYESFKQNV